MSGPVVPVGAGTNAEASTFERLRWPRVRWEWRLPDALGDAIYVIDRVDARIAFANRAAEEQTGSPRSELIGTSVLRFVPDPGGSALRRLLDELADVEEPTRTFAGALQRPDGALVPVEAIVQRLAHPVFDGAAVLTVRDRFPHQEADAASVASAVLEDRERIADALHDRVVQSLSATGLGLAALSAQAGTAEVEHRVARALADLDATIGEIRAIAFDLTGGRVCPPGTRAAIVSVLREATLLLGFTPSVRFHGPLDTAATGATREALVATLREVLVGIGGHAGATQVWVEVTADEQLCLEVSHDGDTIASRSSDGHQEVMARASRLGGRCDVVPRDGGGTHLWWSVPMHG